MIRHKKSVRRSATMLGSWKQRTYKLNRRFFPDNVTVMAVVELPIDDADAALYTVGQVAAMLDVPMAFLRRLDEQRVVVPNRSAGGQRRYSRREIHRIAEVIELTGEGLTLAGVRRVLDLQARVKELEEDKVRRDQDSSVTGSEG
ncbi:helix-turn-helix domain-containing protein [Streptomyces mirabilis]|uniref:helix-turn-helix domain-containing protein n=1 Tax=Streptomyces mirabilis TaxID=68239 RepID=UPI0033304F3E